ncbi:MAG: DUF6985 domain-containing protein [Gimesia chilikensis]|uniref:DUF6985 domain-containing protein n=1 Tax=Gimesia chilikensis TaxID=2605989 RepID=UPI0037A22DF4
MSAFLDQFEPDPEMDGETLVWKTDKPLFQDAVVAFAPPYPEYPKLKLGRGRQPSCDPSCPSARDVGDEIVVTLYSNNDKGFGDYQERAWEYIMTQSPEIETSLRRKLFAQHQKAHKQFLEEYLPDDRKTQNYWKKIENELDWQDASAIDQLYKLVGIGLVDNGLDECGFSSFEFQTGWDRDHGTAILMHKSHVLAAGGMQEDISRGPELIDSIKYVQSYDLDEGDLALTES